VHHSISQIKTNLIQHCAGFISAEAFSFGPNKVMWCDDLPATITHVPVADVPVLNTPDDGRLRPKHVEWLCRNKTCTALHQVGFYLTKALSLEFFLQIFCIYGNTTLNQHNYLICFYGCKRLCEVSSDLINLFWRVSLCTKNIWFLQGSWFIYRHLQAVSLNLFYLKTL